MLDNTPRRAYNAKHNRKAVIALKPTGTTNFAKLRRKKGVTQPALAKASGVNIRAIQKFESGERNIETASLAVALKIADALGVHPRELI